MYADEPHLTISRNRLVQWQMHGATYFVTWRLNSNQPALSDKERSLIASALKYFNESRYVLLAYVVMDDHVHVLVKPKEVTTVSDMLRSWKSYTANRMQRESKRVGAIWQKDTHTHIIRDEDDLYVKAEYILNNPRKRWPGMVDYQWLEVLI
jgi:REP element-mobilizing transposase RayT